MSLLVLAYPVLSKADADFIDAFRSKHDFAYKDVVRPHWTMVFSVPNLTKESIENHVRDIASTSAPISFSCKCGVLYDDAESDDYYIFLVPDAGFSAITRLHDSLYTGVLEDYLRLDIPYVPHIGIATAKDPRHLKSLCDDLNSESLDISGSIDSLTISEYDGKIVRDLISIPLIGTPKTEQGAAANP